MKIRVVLADDHKMFRHALRSMLENDPSIEVVAEASDGEELLAVARTAQPDVVCMDVGMPRLNGIEATRQLRTVNPAVKVIGLSASADKNFVLDMLKAGANGYLTKAEAGEELLRAIHTVQLNRVHLCADVAGVVASIALNGNGRESCDARLGSRERQVLQLIAEGHTSPQIAERLHLASSTVDVHRRNIMRKLDLHSVAELTKYAIRNGLTAG